MAGNTSRESRKMSLFKNYLNYFKHPTHITPVMRYKQGYIIVQSPASCTDSLRGLSIFSVNNLPSQAARAQVASSEAGKLLSGLHNCSPDWSVWFPPQVSRQPLLMIFSPDVGVSGGRKGEWSGQVARVLSIQPCYLGISLGYAVIRCNTSFHPPHDKSTPCSSWKQKYQISSN